ncbi:MAG: hypothetical protein JOY90_16450 [Bradyrhizobium sp.]|uniref:hypothetical protein n=1 Tax=Bradyrhizobium sp. TaxID=376 RepID=UPI001D88827C|nr:hypothetical protein [Bradyrhizobium sp.]MBV9562014.1 hypothetical protein [Bradyrhizobium sp.]
MKKIVLDAKHWRERAKDAVAKAERTWNPRTREKLLRAAAQYEEIARRLEEEGSDPPEEPENGD